MEKEFWQKLNKKNSTATELCSSGCIFNQNSKQKHEKDRQILCINYIPLSKGEKRTENNKTFINLSYNISKSNNAFHIFYVEEREKKN